MVSSTDSATQHPLVTILIPAYNEADTIKDVVSNLVNMYPHYEIIVIDDGSTDGTGDLASRAGAKVLTNTNNLGYGGSLKRGMRKSSGKIILFFDADGQHDCREIKKILTSLKDCDMVVGKRSHKDQVATRKPGKWILTKLAQFLVSTKIPDINSGLRAFRKEDGLRYLHMYPNGFSITTTMTLAMLKDGFDINYIPIRIDQRKGGKSSVKYFKDGMKVILLILRIIMLFGPLRVFVPMSALLLTLGLLYSAFTLFFEHNLTETSILFFLSGLNTLFFGLIADQISSFRRED